MEISGGDVNVEKSPKTGHLYVAFAGGQARDRRAIIRRMTPPPPGERRKKKKRKSREKSDRRKIRDATRSAVSGIRHRASASEMARPPSFCCRGKRLQRAEKRWTAPEVMPAAVSERSKSGIAARRLAIGPKSRIRISFL